MTTSKPTRKSVLRRIWLPRMSDTDFIGQVAGASDESLAFGVQKTEGLNGSTVELVYSTRQMRCYSVTESELQQINLANISISASFLFGSTLLAFYLDIFKDTVLATEVPLQAQTVISYARPILIALGIGFWVFAGVFLFWRRNLVKLIKDESTKS